MSDKNNKLKISTPTQNDKFELPDGSYSVSDIQNYFEYIIKKHETVTHNHPIRIYVNKIENRIAFKVRAGYYLDRLIPEAMKLLGSTNRKINKDKNGKNVPYLEITEVVLFHCNTINNGHQQNSSLVFIYSK